VTTFFLAASIVLLCSVAVALWRAIRGPSPADRILGVQLVSTSGVATILLLAAARQDMAVVDVALVLALLAAFASIAFVKAESSEGRGDPEREEEG